MTHTNVDLALACVRSLVPAVCRDNTVVVLNAPNRVGEQAVRELRAFANVVSPPAPTGYGENVNRGVAALPREVKRVLITNDDVIFAPEAPGILSRTLSVLDEAAVVGPLITDAAQRPVATCHAFPSVVSEILDHVMVPRSIAARFQHYPVAAAPGIQPVDWVLGAVLMVRRDAFESVGGLDPRFVLYSEEIDLCRRLGERGWLTVACGDTSVTHLGGASTGGSGIWQIGAESRNLYITRHWRPWQRACLIGIRPLGDLWNLIYTAAELVREPSHPRAKLRGVTQRHRYMRVSWRWGNDAS